jgi:hypothetical protein
VALTIDLKDAERVANFVVAGSKISLVDYFVGQKGASQTRVVVPSVLVLAVGSTSTSNGAASGSANLITIAASPADALRIVEAQKSGSLTALLLNDVTPTSTNDVSETGIFGGSK